MNKLSFQLLSVFFTSKRSSSHRYMCSSNGVFLEVTNWESSLQEGKDTQVSLRTSWHRASLPVQLGCWKLEGRAR